MTGLDWAVFAWSRVSNTNPVLSARRLDKEAAKRLADEWIRRSDIERVHVKREAA